MSHCLAIWEDLKTVQGLQTGPHPTACVATGGSALLTHQMLGEVGAMVTGARVSQCSEALMPLSAAK